MPHLRRLAFGFVVLVAVLVGGAWWLLRLSLPQLDGTRVLAGVESPVQLDRDALGTVTIHAGSSLDMARALGFVHGQERYFQMDLLRRMAAGELSALVGSAALPVDRSHRAHRFRARARRALAAQPAAARARIDAYRDGVNAGLAALSARPWEYLLLRSRPAPWRSEDSALVVFAMFFDLNSNGANLRELNVARLRAVLPEALVAFLLQPGSEWDAPLRGTALPPPPLPTAEVFDLRSDRYPVPATASRYATLDPEDLGQRPGSNQFAVAGALTDSGSALVANDMHLGLSVPNIWFRARLRYQDAGAAAVDLNGLTLPGVPGLVAGSNRHIAWGFTNSYGDWSDWVRVDRDPQQPQRYRHGERWQNLEVHDEVINVRGAKACHLRVEDTVWGPILAADVDGTPLALQWTAHAPRIFNLAAFELETAADTAAALALAPRIGMPAQNFIVGDAQGAIGWTLTGNGIPLRAGFDPSRPAHFVDGRVGWIGWLPAAAQPRIIDPPAQRLWTANARTVDGDWQQLVGDGGVDLGARAQQLREDLFAHDHFTPATLLAIQLDDRARFLGRWQQLLQHQLGRLPATQLAELRRLTAHWSGRASIESVDFRLVRGFRLKVIEAVLAPFEALAKQRFADFALPSAQGYEAAVWALLQSRPAHLLDPRFADWDALLIAAAEQVDREFAVQPGGLSARSWGEANSSRIRHPLSAALPKWLAAALDMPSQALPGDNHMPRVQTPSFGASERFAIAPGHEDQSYLMMPGGQSPHPLSPFHRAGHADWAAGRPTPLLPGPRRYRLTLQPTPTPAL